MQRALRTALRKLDNLAIDGLAGVENSLGYEVQSVEQHHHGESFPCGNDGANNLEAHSLDPFVLTAGAGDAFGGELQIHDGSVLPGVLGPMCDIGRCFVQTVNQFSSLYEIEFWAGSGAFGAATRVSGFYYQAASANARTAAAIFPCLKFLSTDNLWARVKCKTDSKTIDFLLEIHGYVG